MFRLRSFQSGVGAAGSECRPGPARPAGRSSHLYGAQPSRARPDGVGVRRRASTGRPAPDRRRDPRRRGPLSAGAVRPVPRGVGPVASQRLPSSGGRRGLGRGSAVRLRPSPGDLGDGGTPPGSGTGPSPGNAPGILGRGRVAHPVGTSGCPRRPARRRRPETSPPRPVVVAGPIARHRPALPCAICGTNVREMGPDLWRGPNGRAHGTGYLPRRR